MSIYILHYEHGGSISSHKSKAKAIEAGLNTHDVVDVSRKTSSGDFILCHVDWQHEYDKREKDR